MYVCERVGGVECPPSPSASFSHPHCHCHCHRPSHYYTHSHSCSPLPCYCHVQTHETLASNTRLSTHGMLGTFEFTNPFDLPVFALELVYNAGELACRFDVDGNAVDSTKWYRRTEQCNVRI
jgi:hypothetical protein